MGQQFLTYNQQINKLEKDKHLVINNPKLAEKELKKTGYYSLIGGYKKPFLDKTTGNYYNTKFEDVLALAEFDKELREIIFKYLCDVEVNMRQLISYAFCDKFGEQQTEYLNSKNYNNNDPKNVSKLVNILKKIATQDARHPYVVYQRKKYNNVPLWATVKVLTFGNISAMYSCLPNYIQTQISKEFKSVNENELGKYLELLTMFRNQCAHNERLFSYKIGNKDFPDKILLKKMNIPKKGNKYIYGKNDLFGVIIALRYLLPKERFIKLKKELSKAIDNYQKGNNRLGNGKILELMGFPKNWKDITRYSVI